MTTMTTRRPSAHQALAPEDLRAVDEVVDRLPAFRAKRTAQPPRALEIAGRLLLRVERSWTCNEALSAFEQLRVAAAPVVDAAGRVVGIATWRDVLRGGDAPVSYGAPATIGRDATVAEAAAALASSNGHHVVVVDEGQRPLGVVSSIDVVRASTPAPRSSAPSAPSYFEGTGEIQPTWSPEAPFSLEGAEAAPAGAGVLVLFRRHALDASDVVWVEDTDDLQERLRSIVAAPQHGSGLGSLVQRGGLHYRTLQIADPAARRSRVEAILAACPRCVTLPPDESPSVEIAGGPRGA